MHKNFIVVAVVALLGLAAWSATQSTAFAQSEELVLIEQTGSEVYVDLAAPGGSVGDIVPFSNQLFLADGETLAGVNSGFCTVTQVTTNGVYLESCVMTLLLEGGSLSAQGAFYSGGDAIDWTITGGTGSYLNARGAATITIADGKATWAFNIITG